MRTFHPFSPAIVSGLRFVLLLSVLFAPATAGDTHGAAGPRAGSAPRPAGAQYGAAARAAGSPEPAVSPSGANADDSSAGDDDSDAGDDDSSTGDDRQSIADSSSTCTRFEHWKSFTIPAGKVQKGDRYMVEREGHVDGTLDGDLLACGQSMNVKGSVTGDVNFAGNKLNISGEVGDDLRFAVGEGEVSGKVAGDLLGFGGNLSIEPGAVIGGRTILGGGRASLSGEYKGPVEAGAGDIMFNGIADGNVRLKADAIEFGPEAHIKGNLSYTAREEMDSLLNSARSGHKIVEGTVTFVPKSPEERKSKGFFSGMAFSAWSFLAAFVLGCVLIAIARGTVAAITDTAQGETLKSLGFGVLGHVFAPFAGIILLVLCITLPVGAMVLVVWAMLFYLAKLVVSLALADGLFKRMGLRVSPFLSLFLGMIPVWILFRVPVLGSLLYWFVVPIFGIGATLIGIRARMKAREAPAAPHDTPAHALA